MSVEARHRLTVPEAVSGLKAKAEQFAGQAVVWAVTGYSPRRIEGFIQTLRSDEPNPELIKQWKERKSGDLLMCCPRVLPLGQLGEAASFMPLDQRIIRYINGRDSAIRQLSPQAAWGDMREESKNAVEKVRAAAPRWALRRASILPGLDSL